MWHTLLHATNLYRLISILESKKLGNKFETIGEDLDNKHYFYNKEILFTHYLSSELENIFNKQWTFKPNLIIGISPMALEIKDNEWIMCDRMGFGECYEEKFKIVTKNNKTKKVDFELINNFINKRLSNYCNEIIIRQYKYEHLNKLYKKLNESFINDGKKEAPWNKKSIIKQINNLENKSDIEIKNSRNFKNDSEPNSLVESHEIVFLKPIDIKYISFIIIRIDDIESKNIKKKELINKLYKLLPKHVKIITTNTINNYKLGKKLYNQISEVADKME